MNTICQQKKNSAILIVLGLLLSGCFHNPKETALENCADSSFMDKNPHSYNRITANPLLSEKITKKLEKELSQGNIKSSLLNIKNSTSILVEFAEKNFNLNEEEIKTVLKTSAKGAEGFSDEVLEMLGIEPDVELTVRKIATGTEEQKNQFREIIKDYNAAKNRHRLHKEFRSKLTTYLFLNMKMKDKFLEEKYQKLYQKCEMVFNELPSSFINKWEYSTKLKEFL